MRLFRSALAALSLFAVAAAQEIPRPEHPQPQFQREQWLSLNGKWEFEFDDADAGLAQNWASGAKKFSKSILVPYCFESKLSGIGDTSFHPQVWYKRTFAVPDSWQGKRVLLNFGAVDYQARIWINGAAAGEHEGGNVPIRLDATPYLKKGPNTLVVRAWDPPQDRSIPRGKQYWEPKSRGIFYTRTSGIWQPVWIEAAGDSYLEKVRTDAGQDGVAKFEARIARPQPGLEFQVTVRDGARIVATATVPVSAAGASGAVQVKPVKLWSPGSPNLYDVTFELRKGDAVDRVQSYIGFRTVGVENGRVTVNNRPIYLKFLLDQGYWRESILTPPTDEAMKYDIRMSKEMGFNGCRKHQKVEDPRFLYWADKMGFLVSGEMANAYVFDEAYVARMTHEWIEAVERDYNHPCVIVWAPLNESWGVPNLRDPRQQQHLRALYTLTRSLDNTRLVIDNEGWQHVESTDLFAVHDYARTGEMLYDRWKDPQVGKPGHPFPPGGPGPLVPGYAYNGTPLYLSEFGGIAYIPAGNEVPATAWGYSGVEKTADSALSRLRGLYEALAKMPHIAGICYTQTTDVEQEINGVMTFDRKPKFDVKAMKAINDLLK